MISIGFIVGTAVTFGLIAVATALMVAVRRSSEWSAPSDRRSAWGMYTLAVLIVLGGYIGFGWPVWDLRYHTWDTVSGTVVAVDKRMIAEDNGTSEKFVLQLEGDPQQYGCEDTRCALITPGEAVVLECMWTWEYPGADGRDCKYVSSGGRS